ncbi:MAG: Ig-like domain-containing protein [Christensenellales bacterium]|jgi:hypothetical protein
MKRIILMLSILLLAMPLMPAQAAGKREPKLVLLTMQPGDSQAIDGDGAWESQHPDIATVSPEGMITAMAEGYTLVLCKNKKNNIIVRCEVQVGSKETPAEIQQAIDLAIADWEKAGGTAFPKYNIYTQWYNPAAKNGFGWCGAFVGYHFDAAGVEMNKEFRAKNAPPLTDGTPFAVRQASQTKLFEGFQSRNRLTNIPQPGYYIIYGRKGSTPYTHVGLITAVQPMDNGVYMLDTVEGNLNNRIKRYRYLYDSLADKKTRNISAIPPELQTEPDHFNYSYVDIFYINVFGQTWY